MWTKMFQDGQIDFKWKGKVHVCFDLTNFTRKRKWTMLKARSYLSMQYQIHSPNFSCVVISLRYGSAWNFVSTNTPYQDFSYALPSQGSLISFEVRNALEEGTSHPTRTTSINILTCSSTLCAKTSWDSLYFG